MEPQSEGVPDPPGPSNHPKKIVVMICAMERKANGKPMRAIIAKMVEFYGDWLEFHVLPERVILNDPVEHWPLCDCLISFHSTDFPLHKAIDYERLRRPYIINDLHRQYDLVCSPHSLFYQTSPLCSWIVGRSSARWPGRASTTHRHCVLMRDEDGKVIGGELKETNDQIEINGMVFTKPFVEKPIAIYFHSSVGGGSQRLFRKVSAQNAVSFHDQNSKPEGCSRTCPPFTVNDRASWYSNAGTVRRDGSYIYEDFIPADGTDVKVYAVGPYYAHAEARKAPGLDGRVERDSHGKEVRYPIILTAKEKLIARRVVIAFGQTVCGFDLLRANGKSYVCDVNGFSFVKSSTKYYEDTAKILGNTILRRLASSLSIPWEIPYQAEDPPLVSTTSGQLMELRCVIAVIRHGDRTPKQKIKVVVNDSRFFDLFKLNDGTTKKEIKMKKPSQLQEVLKLVREVLQESRQTRWEYEKKIAATRDEKERSQLEARHEKVLEQVKVFDQIRIVLEMYGHFSGINRKVQLKHLKPKDDQSDDEKSSAPLLLIVKWGGELTTAGHLQAEALGKLFRTLYPGIRRTDGKNCSEDDHARPRLPCAFTPLTTTAAAFAKGLLALEGELTPILSQMVKSGNTDTLLNNDYEARKFQNELKTYLHSILQVDRDFTPEDYQSLNPSNLRSINSSLDWIKNPRKMCREIAGYVHKMVEIIRWHRKNNPTRSLYLNESWDLAERRWVKEYTEFTRSAGKTEEKETEAYDISKIPDHMADVVVPQEYGITEESKISIAQRVCTPLVAKIRGDLHRCVQSQDDQENEGESLTRLDPRASEGVATPMRHVRTRLYFTSESHIHTLMNLLRYGGLCPSSEKWQRAMKFLSGVAEFNYLSQLVLMVYESTDEGKDPMDRFHIELLFSPGKCIIVLSFLSHHSSPLPSPPRNLRCSWLFPCFLTEKERIYESRFASNKQKHQQPLTSGTEEPPGQHESDREQTDNEGGGIERHSSTNLDSLPDPKRSPISEPSFEQAEGEKTGQSKKPEAQESDEELTDTAVNLVVLDEVVGKKYSEMSRPSTIQTVPRKRHPTPELKSSFVPSPLLSPTGKQRACRTIKELDKWASTDETKSPTIAGDGNRASAHRQLNTICLAESPDSGLILDANQATVGSSRGQWAKEIMLEKKAEEGGEKRTRRAAIRANSPLRTPNRRAATNGHRSPPSSPAT
ncbi:Inositol hexakisphosphate and diphosphoinositol-pentakisphosphate kinase [Aphelenchoides fujianensis]|nr:Inositol hexakisphosphate and diphosphoinositol-pentakisphosphate kinase [Aphelenchoides fujianensis]